jgi:hypothetical protein
METTKLSNPKETKINIPESVKVHPITGHQGPREEVEV